jgi:SPP1 family predicted phage head-tail adaptor
MAKKTAIGERRHRLRIEERAASRSEYGEAVDEWETVAEVWCKPAYQQAGSGESLAGDMVVSATSVVFDIAYRDGIEENMRLVFEGNRYSIAYIQKPDFRESLLMRAERVE